MDVTLKTAVRAATANAEAALAEMSAGQIPSDAHPPHTDDTDRVTIVRGLGFALTKDPNDPSDRISSRIRRVRTVIDALDRDLSASLDPHANAELHAVCDAEMAAAGLDPDNRAHVLKYLSDSIDMDVVMIMRGVSFALTKDPSNPADRISLRVPRVRPVLKALDWRLSAALDPQTEDWMCTALDAQMAAAGLDPFDRWDTLNYLLDMYVDEEDR